MDRNKRQTDKLYNRGSGHCNDDREKQGLTASACRGRSASMVTLVSQYTARLCRSTSLYIMSASSWLTNLGTCSANSYICCTACPHCHGSQTGVPAVQTVTSVVQHVCIIMAHKLGYLQTVMPVHHSCTTMVPIFRHVLTVMHHYTGIPVLWHHSTLVPQYTGVTAH